MTFTSLMVHLDIGRPNTAVLNVASDLAERFDAEIVGMAVCPPSPIVYSDAYVSSDVFNDDRRSREQGVAAARAEFLGALDGRSGHLTWRAVLGHGPVSDHLAAWARGADLIITGPAPDAASFEPARDLDRGELVLRAGRPVLIVPPAVERGAFERALICWTDTREARRAVADALPLLRKAAHVAVVEVAAEAELAAARTRLADVATWLGRHGITAATIAAASNGHDAARLQGVAREQAADFLVAGGYGHTRLREWLVGGVTRDLMLHTPLCALVSH